MASASPEGRHSFDQRPFRIRKSLRELIHKPRSHRQKRLSLPLPSLPSRDPSKEDYTYDVLYECQRGSWAVGYSSKTLLQFDPSPWCDVDMKYTPMNIKTYQLPDPTWEWVNKEWVVDMTDDVDEAGWQYSLKFHGAVWHGNYKHFRSFVRRRRWIRLRHRQQCLDKDDTNKARNDDLSTASRPVSARKLVDVEDTPSQSTRTDETNGFMARLGRCRLDRERLAVLNETMALPAMQAPLLAKARDCMQLLDYETSKRKFVELLLHQHHDTPPDQSLQSVTPDKRLTPCLSSLCFYSDIQAVLEDLEVL